MSFGSCIVILDAISKLSLVFIHRGGLRPGDIIQKINDKDIKSSADVYRAVETNDVLTMDVHRGSEVITLTVRTEEIID